MSKPVAFIFAYLLLALELVLPSELRLGPSRIAPSFVVPFVVYVAMFAPTLTALWLALLMGLALDLTSPIGSEGVIIAGPRALGMLASAYLVLTLRTIINRNTLALIVFSIVAAGLGGVVVVAVFTLRAWYTPGLVWHASDELVQRLFSALYTGATAGLLGLVLFPAYGLFRFQDPYSRRTTFRPY